MVLEVEGREARVDGYMTWGEGSDTVAYDMSSNEKKDDQLQCTDTSWVFDLARLAILNSTCSQQRDEIAEEDESSGEWHAVTVVVKKQETESERDA